MSAQRGFFSANLAGVEVGETAISEVCGDEGILSYRGQRVETLVVKPFWQVVWLLLCGQWPTREQEQELNAFMLLHGRLDAGEIRLLKALPRGLHPMLVLQGLVPLLEPAPRTGIGGLEDTALRGLAIAAKLPGLLAGWRQLELGGEPANGNIELGFHENFLQLFTGHVPSPLQLRVLDAVQILQLEHGFNAGTFAGRVCASTLAPIQSSISASIGTLFGPLHGGADQAALEMAREIGTPDKARDYVEDCLAHKRKIMGMGHREYRVVDPRARILKPMARELCNRDEALRLLQVLEAVEESCRRAFQRKGKEIHANVEFYKGAVFHTLGIPPHYFTAMFAMARVYGYIAHYQEFMRAPQLIRPKARYIGSALER